MIDARLLGTWKSDARRTRREIRARNDLPEAELRSIGRMFGKLELRYTRKFVYSDFDGTKQRSEYTILAKDASSVMVSFDDGFHGVTLQHIHFEGPFYWISLGKIREFFRKNEG